MAQSDFRSSPLLSTLGMVALAGTLAPMACRDEGQPPPIDDVSDVLDVYQDFYAFYCECYAEVYGEVAVDECLAEADIASDGEQACLQGVFDANPAAFEVVRCQTEALRGLFGCVQADGCPVPFTCAGGETVPGSFVCDGYADCEDGSDESEAQGCPPLPTCADGQQFDTLVLCNGYEDCADGSDELDCPPPFQCGDDTQIPSGFVCNGFDDCEDGSDEEQDCPETCESRWEDRLDACGEVSEQVEAQLEECYGYRCFDGAEIPRDQVCNGVNDCPDGEDEIDCG